MDFRATTKDRITLENELFDARTGLRHAGRELSETETASFPLIKLGAAAQVGSSVGGAYGLIIAVTAVYAFEKTVMLFHHAELSNAVKDAEFAVFFAEKELREFDKAEADMPPVWRKDP